MPAAGALTSLGFIGYRLAKRHPYASERERIARRRAALSTQSELLAEVGCADANTVARLARAAIDRIDAQVYQVDRRAGAITVDGPMTLTVAGGVTALGFGFATLISWLMTTPLTHNPRDPNPALFAGLGTGALVGVAMATTGIVWTVRRKREQRELASDAQRLRERRKHFELMIQPSASAQHAGLALRGRF